MLSEADRLGMLTAVGAEKFDTGQAEPVWAVFSGEFEEAFAGDHVASVEVLELECRTSDVTAHDLKKDSALRRLSDDSVYKVKRLEPSRSSGFTRVVLTSVQK